MRTNKVSYQMNQGNRFIFYDYFQGLVKDDPMTRDQGYETKQNNDQPQHTTKLEWQGVKGNTLVMSLQVSRWRSHVTQNIRGLGPETLDTGTQFQSGTNNGAGNIVEHWRPWATRGTIGWYRPDQGAGLIGAVIGALIVLFIWHRLVVTRTIDDPGVSGRRWL